MRRKRRCGLHCLHRYLRSPCLRATRTMKGMVQKGVSRLTTALTATPLKTWCFLAGAASLCRRIACASPCECRLVCERSLDSSPHSDLPAPTPTVAVTKHRAQQSGEGAKSENPSQEEEAKGAPKANKARGQVAGTPCQACGGQRAQKGANAPRRAPQIPLASGAQV